MGFSFVSLKNITVREINGSVEAGDAFPGTPSTLKLRRKSGMLPKGADVVIIGGGVIGASIAYHLSRKKVAVVLLEKGDMASGTSGACGGHIFLQSKRPGPHLALALESKKRFDLLIQELDFHTEYRVHGGMIVIESDDELETMGHFVEDQKRIGLDVTLLDKRDVRKMAPFLSEHILGAAYSPLDAQINPIYLTLALIKAAKRSGARIFSHSEATGIRWMKHKAWSVETVRGAIEATSIVNAAGIYAPKIGSMIHLEVPITPRRGQILVTEAAPPILKPCLLSAKYVRAKHDPESIKGSGAGVSIEQTRNGNFLLGSTREFAGFDRRTTWEAMKGIARRTAGVFPRLRQLHVIRSFAGLRPYTPDGLPILGQAESAKGFFVAAGHEGDGIALAPITGEIMTDLVIEGRSSMDLHHFRLERFPVASGPDFSSAP
jgi:glycine/D-amino acid oxidase-like deaminating enzyme